MSKVEVDAIVPQSGTTITIGESGDTVALGSGATQTGFGLSNWSESSGNLLPSNSTYGIYLGVNSATASNLLDDYEEGTFTPSFTSSGGGSATMGSNTDGLYVKTGNVVYITANLQLTTNSLSSGVLRVSGLPFTPSGESGYRNATAFFSYTVNVSPQPFSGTFRSGEAYISVWRQGNNSTYQATDFNNGGRAVVSGFYFIL